MLLKKYFYLSTGLLVLLMGIRFFYTGNITYVFLLWNVFLAWVPFGISRILRSKQPTSWFNYSMLFVWLLFLPNAPYIITDLMHLTHVKGMPVYFDVILILIAVLQGLVYFYASIFIVKRKLIQYLPKHVNTLFIPAVFVLSGLGVYLGRYSRYNSWDIVTKPNIIIQDVLQSIIHPIENAYQWKICLLFTLFFFIVLSAINYSKKIATTHETIYE
jgi:uncharacterized membrane protein